MAGAEAHGGDVRTGSESAGTFVLGLRRPVAPRTLQARFIPAARPVRKPGVKDEEAETVLG